jgi:hypothetical protein
MSQKIINKDNGEITINNFIVSAQTKLEDLLTHFGKDIISKSTYTSDYYFLPQMKIDEYYIKFSFKFREDMLQSVNFEIETEPVEREPWGNNRDVETKWIADQMDDKSNFIWNMNVPKQYILKHSWGYIGVIYDFKNSTFDSGLHYNNFPTIKL